MEALRKDVAVAVKDQKAAALNMPSQQKSSGVIGGIVKLLGLLALVLVAFAGYSIFVKNYSLSSEPGSPGFGLREAGVDVPVQSGATTVDILNARISDAYRKIDRKDMAPGDRQVVEALTTFREIAADENNPPLQRAQALNGINFTYTQLNFNAADLKAVVFSKPPFGKYYEDLGSTAPDPIHPESGSDAAAVEAALVKLNILSNSILPNHYALARLEVARIFKYQRESSAQVGKTSAEIRAMAEQAAEEIKPLVEAFEAISPPLHAISADTMPMPMRVQIMLVHASALSFIGYMQNNRSFHDRGEVAFMAAIKAGDEYPQTAYDYQTVLNQTLIARINYASYFWKRFKTSDPERVMSVLRPLVDEEKIKNTATYNTYIPNHKDVKIPPFSTLRDIAGQMPELKTFLQGRGFVF